MFLKLNLQFNKWRVPGAAGGVIASLNANPEIINKLPVNAKVGVYNQSSSALFSKEITASTFYIPCDDMKQSDIQQAIKAFKQHYHNYQCHMPSAHLASKNPLNNELIDNLLIALQRQKNPDNPSAYKTQFTILNAEDACEVHEARA